MLRSFLILFVSLLLLFGEHFLEVFQNFCCWSILSVFFFFINLLHSYIAFHCELKANNTAQRYTHKQIKRGLNNVGGWIYNF